MFKLSLPLIGLSLCFSGLAQSSVDYFGPAKPQLKISSAHKPGLFFLDFGGRKVFFDCETKTPRLAAIPVKRGVVHLAASTESLYFERSIPPKCQPSTKLINGFALASMTNEQGRVTHVAEKLIPSEVVVNSTAESDESDIEGLSVTNFFPAIRPFKHGPWSKYKQYLQCLRAQTDFTLINGLIPSDEYNEDNDSLKKAYRVSAPGYVFSAIVFSDGTSQAFVFSNQPTARMSMNNRLPFYIMPISKVEQIFGEALPLPKNTRRDFVNYTLHTKHSDPNCQNL